MYRTIVVGYDGSEQADDALALAQQLRDPDGGRLVIACVFPFYRGFAFPVGPALYATMLLDDAEATLRDAVAELDPGVPHVTRAIAESSPARALNDLAEAEDADVIVLGSTHSGTAARLAGRATVQRLLHGAPCAVAIAAPGQRSRRRVMRRIGVAYDASAEAREALERAYALAAAHHADVLVCRAVEMLQFGSSYVATEDDARLRHSLERLARRQVEEATAMAPEGVSAGGAVSVGRPVPAILEGCGDVDLLVAGSRSYGPLRRALVGSTSLGLAAHADVPLLIVPRPAEEPEPEEPVPALATEEHDD
jgi:nucleotide-binding universal stress UspA family protein